MFIVRGKKSESGRFEVCRTIGIKSPRVVEVIFEVADEDFAKTIVFLLKACKKKYGIYKTKKFIENFKKNFQKQVAPIKKIDPACDLTYTTIEPQLGDMGATLTGEFPISFTRKLN